MAYRKKSARTRSYRLSLVRRKRSSAWHSASNSSSDKSRHRASSERSRCSPLEVDRKSTRLNSSHLGISYAVFCLKKRALRRLGGRVENYRCEVHGLLELLCGF